MRKKIVIFGATGNTGAYLTEYYGPALRQTAGDLTGVRIAVTAHRNTAAASAGQL